METHLIRDAFGDEQAIAMMKEAGFDAIDYTFFSDPRKWLLRDDYRDYAQSIRDCLDRHGMTCAQSHAPFVWSNDKNVLPFRYGMPMDESCEGYLGLVRAMEAASIMGSPYIVVHTIALPDDQDPEEYNLTFYRSLLPYCERFGIRIAIENLFTRKAEYGILKPRFGTAKDLCNLIRKLDSQWFVACVDLGHAAVTGTEPHNFIRDMEPEYLKVLHVQDTDYRDDRHYLPYIGLHQWDKITAALQDKHFDGAFSMELPGFLRRLPSALYPDALTYAAKVGRYLISLVEQ